MSIKIKAHIFACKKCNCKDCELYLCRPSTCDKYNEHATAMCDKYDEYVKLYDEIATEQKQIDIEKLKEVMNRLMLDTKDKAEIIKIMHE